MVFLLPVRALMSIALHDYHGLLLPVRALILFKTKYFEVLFDSDFLYCVSMNIYFNMEHPR